MKPKIPLEESRTLAFTFVPVSGTLPTQVSLGKDMNSLPKTVNRKEEKAHKPSTTIFCEHFSEERLKENDRPSLDSWKPSSTEHNFARKEAFTGDFDEMQNDLFIAEFVLIMDSDEDKDETMDRYNHSVSSPERSNESRVKWLPMTQEHGTTIPLMNVKNKYVAEVQRDVDFQEKEQQLYSSVPVTSPSQYTQQYTNTIPTTEHILHNSNDKWPSKHHNLTCSSPENIQKEHYVERYSPTPNKHMFCKEHNIQDLDTPLVTQLAKAHDTQRNKRKYSNFSNNYENQTQSFPILPRASHETLSIQSPLPIRIFKHPLCPSPSPLQSPCYGSSSTLCSTSMSPTPSFEMSSRVPSRLSFLTSLLRSKNLSHKRPCTPEINYYYLTSKQPQSTSVLIKHGSPLMETRKSQSCFSLHNQNDSKIPQIQTQSDMLPSASESNILQPQSSLYRRPMRTLSPNSIYFKTTSSSVVPKKSSHFSNEENVSTLNVKPPLNKDVYKPLKKYSALGKSRKVTLSPPVSPYKESDSNFINLKQTALPNTKMYSPPGHFKTRDNNIQRYVDNYPSEIPSMSMYLTKTHDLSHSGLQTFHKLSSERDSKLSIPTPINSLLNSDSNIFHVEELPGKVEQIFLSSNNAQSPSGSSLSRCSDISSTHSLSQCSELDNKKMYKIKSSYKVFAAIPTNTLLRDQKAIDEPEANSAYDETLEARSKMCTPAQLRKETDEICAVIDKVLHDPLPLHNEPAARSPKMTQSTVTTRMAKPQSKSAGRETKYASLHTKAATNKSSSATKPGVIRPITLTVTLEEQDDDTSHPCPFVQSSESLGTVTSNNVTDRRNII